MTLQEQLHDLDRRAKGQYYPLVDCRWGYAAFVAYVFKIDMGEQPSEWWVVEMGKGQQAVAIKRICQY